MTAIQFLTQELRLARSRLRRCKRMKFYNWNNQEVAHLERLIAKAKRMDERKVFLA